ncbi:MORN repeat-containing protein [Methylocystis echinoides]|uniref:MORN repeat-containing protein n=1 Tax=Methylocystis echinoides TaxID=29468 RepID=A0A9W6GSW9_9HYPH|nr:hypothetical protein [Methylocystis echinoides]GLI92329.1 hypothetical protein LMG27198_13210 [Methylocystis echinoides]
MLRSLILSAAMLVAAPQLAAAQSKQPPCPTSRKIAWTDCDGSYTYDDWSTYVGGFKDDKRHGQGAMVYPDGQKYVGGFKFDRRDGPGVYTSPNRNRWAGEFRDDQPNGRGVLTDKDGKVLKAGVWEKGVFVEDAQNAAK